MHEVKPPLQSVLGRYRLTCCDWVLVLHFRKEVDQTQSVREHKSLLGKKSLENLTFKEKFGMMSIKKFQGDMVNALQLHKRLARNIK